LIEEVVKNKESFSLNLESLRYSLAEKTSDLTVITSFSKETKETKVRLENVRNELERQRERHRLARVQLEKKIDAELEGIAQEWDAQLEETKESLERMTEDNLDKETRR